MFELFHTSYFYPHRTLIPPHIRSQPTLDLHNIILLNYNYFAFFFLNFSIDLTFSDLHFNRFFPDVTYFLKGYQFLPKIVRRRFVTDGSPWYHWKPMVTIGNRWLPSVTIGWYQILPMATNGRTPNAPMIGYTTSVICPAICVLLLQPK